MFVFIFCTFVLGTTDGVKPTEQVSSISWQAGVPAYYANQIQIYQ